MATYQNLSNFDGLKVGDIVEYTYSGASFPVTVKKGTYKITAYGAQGGWNVIAGNNNTLGGSAIGFWENGISDRQIFVRVGGSGNNGGFNGGGDNNNLATNIGGGGGGASDIRLDVDDLYHRLLVGGGGGGDGYIIGDNNRRGGIGGGSTGGDAVRATYGGRGGSQIAGGSAGMSISDGRGVFGNGANALYYSVSGNGGGGGGWYGGGSGYRDYDYGYGGGGGSGFTWTNQSLTLPSGGVWSLTSDDALSSTTLTQGGRTGDGLVTIEVIAFPPIYKLATDGTDTYAFIDPEWEVVVEGEHEPDAQAFLDYGVLDIPNFDGLPAGCHLLVYDPEQDNKEFILNIESNPPEQVITMRSGVALPFAVTAKQPTLTKVTDGGGTAKVTSWGQAGNRVNVGITMTKPSRSATASVLEIKVPYNKVE